VAKADVLPLNTLATKYLSRSLLPVSVEVTAYSTGEF